MAKNMVQFQKGISISEFIDQYGTEEKCRDALVKFKWPKGFCCAYCGNPTYCEIRHRKIYQCNRCHHQTSIIAGTIFHKTHLPFTKWFLAIYLITQNKNGISAMALSRQIGVSYNAAYRLKQKLMQAMLECGSGKKLHGRVEIDDSYLGGKRIPGKRGRGAGKKAPFIAAVEIDMDKHQPFQGSK